MQSKPNESTNSEALYSSLFDCIGKNKTIHTLVSQVECNQSIKIQELLKAIQDDNPNADIFNDEDCPLYLLSLIKNKQLDFHQGMSIYIYLISLQQFTPNLHLKPCDVEFESQRDLQITKLMNKNDLTEDGEYYLKRVAKSLQYFSNEDCYEELTEFVSKLEPSERWILKIAFSQKVSVFANNTKSQVSKTGFDAMLFTISTSNGAPFFQFKNDTILNPLDRDRNAILYFPSQSIIQFCLNKLSNNPLTPTFVFGATGLHTLNNYHRNNKHPILLYSNAVKSNITSAHNYTCGPLGGIFHDLIHTHWGNLLPFHFRTHIYKFLIPNFTIIRDMALQNNNHQVSEYTSKLMLTLGDFDLQSLISPKEKKICQFYIQKALALSHPNHLYTNSQKLGKRQYDFLLFQMEKLKFQQTNWSLEQINLWNELMDRISSKVNDRRTEKLYPSNTFFKAPVITYSQAILKLAQNALNPKELTFSANHESIDWDFWLNIVNTSSTSEELWSNANTKKSELLYLITQCNLTFFHPYLPMTDDYKSVFKAFLEENRVLYENKETNPNHSLMNS